MLRQGINRRPSALQSLLTGLAGAAAGYYGNYGQARRAREEFDLRRSGAAEDERFRRDTLQQQGEYHNKQLADAAAERAARALTETERTRQFNAKLALDERALTEEGKSDAAKLAQAEGLVRINAVMGQVNRLDPDQYEFPGAAGPLFGAVAEFGAGKRPFEGRPGYAYSPHPGDDPNMPFPEPIIEGDQPSISDLYAQTYKGLGRPIRMVQEERLQKATADFTPMEKAMLAAAVQGGLDPFYAIQRIYALRASGAAGAPGPAGMPPQALPDTDYLPPEYRPDASRQQSLPSLPSGLPPPLEPPTERRTPVLPPRWAPAPRPVDEVQPGGWLRTPVQPPGQAPPVLSPKMQLARDAEARMTADALSRDRLRGKQGNLADVRAADIRLLGPEKAALLKAQAEKARADASESRAWREKNRDFIKMYQQAKLDESAERRVEGHISDQLRVLRDRATQIFGAKMESAAAASGFAAQWRADPDNYEKYQKGYESQMAANRLHTGMSDEVVAEIRALDAILQNGAVAKRPSGTGYGGSRGDETGAPAGVRRRLRLRDGRSVWAERGADGRWRPIVE